MEVRITQFDWFVLMGFDRHNVLHGVCFCWYLSISLKREVLVFVLVMFQLSHSFLVVCLLD